MIKKFLRLVTDNRKLKVCKISKKVNISTERVHNILHNHLNMRKLCTQWVLRVLTDQQKLERADVSQYNLDMFKHNTKEFLRLFVTVNETWIHHYTPESKELSRKRVELGGKCTEAAESATIGWHGYGNCFLGCTWYNSY